MTENLVAVSLGVLCHPFIKDPAVEKYPRALPSGSPHLAQQIGTVDVMHADIKNNAGIVA